MRVSPSHRSCTRPPLAMTLLGLCAACLATACAPSALIRPDDQVFAAAEQHLARSEDSEAAPAHLGPDAVLFLQAESFFHYRLSLGRPRGPLLYALEIAAAATDFVPLTVAAASGSLLDVRLHAYDAAGQLYEQLLSTYPNSPLRPEALYRLGWVYRNTTVEGFPRSSEESFQAVAKDYPASALAPLARDALNVPWRSQDTASVLSLIPGAGQFYAGEPLNGSIRLGIALAFTAMAVLPVAALIQQRRFAWVPTVVSTVGLIGLEVTYTTSYEDAQRAVLQFNETQEQRFLDAHPQAPP